jgi:hypothetical protein
LLPALDRITYIIQAENIPATPQIRNGTCG